MYLRDNFIFFGPVVSKSAPVHETAPQFTCRPFDGACRRRRLPMFLQVRHIDPGLSISAFFNCARLAFGPKFMSRLGRTARSPCRLGPSYRKSVKLKNVSISAFIKCARLAFGPNLMSRLGRTARSPCRLGPSYRKSINLKKSQFRPFLSARV